jgi:metal-sulfur cluster biosynthetic enzyme
VTVDALQTRAIAGAGPPDRRLVVLNAIDSIADPCSQALGRPVGLVGMGIIERVDIVGAHVTISVLPTFPNCMFRGVFEEEIARLVASIAWCEAVSVCFVSAESIWDEQRLSDEARRILNRTPRTERNVRPAAAE